MGKRTDKVLDEFAEEWRLASMRNLGTRTIGKNRSYGATRSRKLEKSLYVKRVGGEIVAGSPLPYAKFIHYGVSGTKKKRNTPYKFTTKAPPTKPIEKWLGAKPVRLRDPKSGEFVKKTKWRLKSAAWVIAQSIKKRGIPGVAYFSEAFETMYPRFQSKIAEAIALDALDDLTDLDNPNLK